MVRVNIVLLGVLVYTCVCFFSFVSCDVYMHSPRGSNNRNCEKNENRNNANRLFDSQNNAKGGYACPRAVGGPEVVTPTMYYYSGSILTVEWTSQHSCGATNNDCQIVLQYMCNDTAPGLRDGQPESATDAATTTIDEKDPDNPNRGQHETVEYYRKCKTRTRNLDLWTADRREENPGTLLQTSPATQTRQNPNGNRNGFECPEERDYYPYWHPTPWRDIAVFTNNITMCNFYKQNSQNVQNKGECVSNADPNVVLKYNNERSCSSSGEGQWVERGAFGTPPPECLSTASIMSRDNHLGSSITGQMASYKWVIPDAIVDRPCVLRLRYNMSSTDIGFSVDSRSNGRVKSPLIQDPFRDFGYASNLSLAVNTNQAGRTFQDRSYVFFIKKRPSNIKSWVKIHNIGVRGKRGNIVQTFPAVEYDFSPTELTIDAADLVHWQWTGSGYNPARNPNDGEGGPKDPIDAQLRSDRSNIVQLDYPGELLPRPVQWNTMFVNKNGKVDQDLVTKFAFIDQDLDDKNETTRCMNWQELLIKNNNNKNEAEVDVQNCAKLNKARTPYFDGGLVRLHATGTFYYYSTRNNNLSNRGQRASITVKKGWVSSAPRTTVTNGAQYGMALLSLLLVIMLSL